MKKTPEKGHTALYFYGFPLKESILEDFFTNALRWFERFGLAPKAMEKGSSKKAGDFRRISAGAHREGFSLEITKSIRLYSAPYFKEDVPKGSDFEAAITHDYCYIRLKDSVSGLSASELHAIAKEIALSIEPGYGISVTGCNCMRLGYFAMGISYRTSRDAVSRKESDRIISWRDTIWKKRFLSGNLGGIFPWNFLTAPQLHAKVGNLTLEHWIREKPHRGTLEPLTDKMMLWAVPEEDIPAVYQALWEAEVVFDYERHCDRMARKSSPTRPMTAEQALGQAMKAFGYESAEEAQVFQVQESGNLKEVPTPEVDQALRKTRKPRKR